VSIEAATVSPQSADAFTEKLARILTQGQAANRGTVSRTQLTEDEVNSWFTYRAQPLLPNGVADPQVTIVGQGRVAGRAIVDLDAVGRRRSTGGLFDPWNLVGGKVPVAVSGILHTREGVGRFEVESAEISGIPVPAGMLQDLLGYYSRGPERPQGVRLDDPFTLPANIRQIEIGPGQAVVVQ
jgi:hypothetical protein